MIQLALVLAIAALAVVRSQSPVDNLYLPPSGIGNYGGSNRDSGTLKAPGESYGSSSGSYASPAGNEDTPSGLYGAPGPGGPLGDRSPSDSYKVRGTTGIDHFKDNVEKPSRLYLAPDKSSFGGKQKSTNAKGQTGLGTSGNRPSGLYDVPETSGLDRSNRNGGGALGAYRAPGGNGNGRRPSAGKVSSLVSPSAGSNTLGASNSRSHAGAPSDRYSKGKVPPTTHSAPGGDSFGTVGTLASMSGSTNGGQNGNIRAPSGLYGVPSRTYNNPGVSGGGPSNTYSSPEDTFGAPGADGAIGGQSLNVKAPSGLYGAPGISSSSGFGGTPSNTYSSPGDGDSSDSAHKTGGANGDSSPNIRTPSGLYGVPSRHDSDPRNSGFGSGPSSTYIPPGNGGKFGTHGAPGLNGGENGNFRRPSALYGVPSGTYNAPEDGGSSGVFGAPSNTGDATSGTVDPTDAGADQITHGAAYNDAGASGNDYDNGEDEQTEPAIYKFSYLVMKAETGVEFGHSESREGDQAFGQYNVVLPDGRKQIVEYTATRDGYRPVIRYEGEVAAAIGFPSGGDASDYPSRGASNGYPSGGPNEQNRLIY